jgi:hypothetical protein
MNLFRRLQDDTSGTAELNEIKKDVADNTAKIAENTSDIGIVDGKCTSLLIALIALVFKSTIETTRAMSAPVRSMLSVFCIILPRSSVLSEVLPSTLPDNCANDVVSDFTDSDMALMSGSSAMAAVLAVIMVVLPTTASRNVSIPRPATVVVSASILASVWFHHLTRLTHSGTRYMAYPKPSRVWVIRLQLWTQTTQMVYRHITPLVHPHQLQGLIPQVAVHRVPQIEQ